MMRLKKSGQDNIPQKTHLLAVGSTAIISSPTNLIQRNSALVGEITKLRLERRELKKVISSLSIENLRHRVLRETAAPASCKKFVDCITQTESETESELGFHDNILNQEEKQNTMSPEILKSVTVVLQSHEPKDQPHESITRSPDFMSPVKVTRSPDFLSPVKSRVHRHLESQIKPRPEKYQNLLNNLMEEEQAQELLTPRRKSIEELHLSYVLEDEQIAMSRENTKNSPNLITSSHIDVSPIRGSRRNSVTKISYAEVKINSKIRKSSLVK